MENHMLVDALPPLITHLQQAKTTLNKKPGDTTRTPPRPQLAYNQLIDEIDNQLDVYYAWLHHAHTHLTRAHGLAYTRVDYTKLPADTPLIRKTLECGCFPERDLMVEELTHLIVRAKQLLEWDNTHHPFPCPHCETIAWWNMSIYVTACKNCGKPVETLLAYQQALAVARSKLNVQKLRTRLNL